MAFTAPKGIQIKLVSPSNEIMGILSDTDNSGPILNAQVNIVKVGGVDKFSFTVDKDTDLPITRNTLAYFYIQGTLWFNGFIKEIPQPDQDIPVLIVEGEGFYKRLEKKVINEDYTAQTLDTIVKDVASNHLGSDVGVFYDVAKIDVPALSGITIEFKDKNLLDIFETLLSICNFEYDTTKYRFYVDNFLDLVFEEISETVSNNLFEGYHYQKPEVSEDFSKVINKVLTFRTTSGDPDVVEFVAAYEDTDSQGRYGLYEKKVTFPDFVDTTTISNIADAILKRRALPQDKVAIKDYELNLPLIVGDTFVVEPSGVVEVLEVDVNGIQDSPMAIDSEITTVPLPFNFGNYGLSNKRTNYWQVIADCDTLTGWNVAGISNTTLTLSETHVLTGKRSMKFVTAAGSNNEFVEFILSDLIALPQKVRIFMYFESVAPVLKITYSDINGNSVDINFSSVTDQWVKHTEDSVQLTQVVDLEVDELADPDKLLQVDRTADPNLQLEVRDEVEPGLLSIDRVRITMLTDSATTFYVDRLDTFASIYRRRTLQLEEITYNLSSLGLFADLNFGEKEDSIIDEIKENVKEGSVALGIFSKQ